VSYSDIGDNELIYLIRSNNYEAKEYLIQRYQKRIYGMINSFKKSSYIQKLDYEDYYHSCFLVFLRCLELFDDDYNFYNYVSGAINKELQKLLKKEKENNDHLSLEYDISDCEYHCDYVSDSSIMYKENELNEYINENFNELDRKIIEYRLAGYNCLEIATLLNVDKKRVYKRLESIKTKLNARLG
jgi:RNA polymerase sigma factor (sigma-70 family)